MTQRFLSGAVLLLVAVLSGCASSLPPAQPATSLESIVGKWEGSLTDRQGEPLYPTLWSSGKTARTRAPCRR